MQMSNIHPFIWILESGPDVRHPSKIHSLSLMLDLSRNNIIMHANLTRVSSNFTFALKGLEEEKEEREERERRERRERKETRERRERRERRVE